MLWGQAKISDLTDPDDDPRCDAGGVHIDIWLDGTDPPAGRVGGDGHELPFRGWMDMMAALTRLLDAVREADGDLGARAQSELGEDV
ncbi:hypothetical protein QF046_003031 [Microbacterium sp. W4I4]|nr:hypothetical protein [Microbacterium sp. W4I4]